MLSSIIEIASGFFNFSSYVSDYFKEKSIRDAQAEKSSFQAKIKTLEYQLEKERKESVLVLEKMKIDHQLAMSQIKDDCNSSSNPRKGKRRISG